MTPALIQYVTTALTHGNNNNSLIPSSRPRIVHYVGHNVPRRIRGGTSFLPFLRKDTHHFLRARALPLEKLDFSEFSRPRRARKQTRGKEDCNYKHPRERQLYLSLPQSTRRLTIAKIVSAACRFHRTSCTGVSSDALFSAGLKKIPETLFAQNRKGVYLTEILPDNSSRMCGKVV